MAGPIAGALIAAGGQLLGGLLGMGGGSNGAIKMHNQTLKKSIQYRAQDARQAGIHPLAALGAGWPNYTPTQSSGQEGIGNAVGNAASIIGDLLAQTGEKDKSDAETARTIAETRLIEAQVNSINGKIGQLGRGVNNGGSTLSDPQTPSNGNTVLNSGDPEGYAKNLSTLGNLFTNTIGTQGQKITQPNMDVAADMETTATSHLENGTFVQWVEKLIWNNSTEQGRRNILALKQWLQRNPTPLAYGKNLGEAHRKAIINRLNAALDEWFKKGEKSSSSTKAPYRRY